MSQNSTSPREEVGRAGCAWLPLWERYDKLCSARVVPLQPHTRERATVVTRDTYRGRFEQGELSSYFFSAAVVSWRKKIYNLSPLKKIGVYVSRVTELHLAKRRGGGSAPRQGHAWAAQKWKPRR